MILLTHFLLFFYSIPFQSLPIFYLVLHYSSRLIFLKISLLHYLSILFFTCPSSFFFFTLSLLFLRILQEFLEFYIKVFIFIILPLFVSFIRSFFFLFFFFHSPYVLFFLLIEVPCFVHSVLLSVLIFID